DLRDKVLGRRGAVEHGGGVQFRNFASKTEAVGPARAEGAQRSSSIIPEIFPAAGPVPQLNSLRSVCVISSWLLSCRFSSRKRSRIAVTLSRCLRNSCFVRTGP